MPDTTEQIHAGQAIHRPKMLAIYDVLALCLSNRWVWKCPTPRALAHYDRHVSGNHLDVGVGAGYFLDSCRFPTSTPRIALMDLNRNALQFGAVEVDSLGVNYLRHCLPGDMATKAHAFFEYAGRFADADARTRKAVRRGERRNRRLRRAVFGAREGLRRLVPTRSERAPNIHRDRGAERVARLHRRKP